LFFEKYPASNIADSKLRPNMSIDLLVVQERKDGVLRLKNGPTFGKSAKHDLYFKKDDMAILQPVRTGLSGDDYIEITEGAEPGDEIIISDISCILYINRITPIIFFIPRKGASEQP